MTENGYPVLLSQGGLLRREDETTVHGLEVGNSRVVESRVILVDGVVHGTSSHPAP